MKVNVTINNIPDYAKTMPGYIVARKADHGELWFYGIYENKEKASYVSREIDGICFEVAE